jgi:hypothetical protein
MTVSVDDCGDVVMRPRYLAHVVLKTITPESIGLLNRIESRRIFLLGIPWPSWAWASPSKHSARQGIRKYCNSSGQNGGLSALQHLTHATMEDASLTSHCLNTMTCWKVWWCLNLRIKRVDELKLPKSLPGFTNKTQNSWSLPKFQLA